MMISYVKNAKNLLSRNASDLLLVGGVGCILAGGILAIRQTPKAILLTEEKKDEKAVEKFKVLAPLYVPSILLTSIGIMQIICSRNITNNKIAAVATAYTVSESAFRTFREKVKDVVEPDKYNKIKKEVAKEKLKKDPIGNKEIIMPQNGNVLMYDSMSGRYFKGDMETINQTVNLLNKRMMSNMNIELNEFYSEIGLPVIKLGNAVGWDMDHDLIELYFTSSIADNGEPCIVLDYDIVPIR